MVIYLAPLVALIGLLLFALAKTPDPKEIGRIMFFCGLLVTLMTSANGSYKILDGGHSSAR
jgi:Na+/phosphate symporter